MYLITNVKPTAGFVGHPFVGHRVGGLEHPFVGHQVGARVGTVESMPAGGTGGLGSASMRPACEISDEISEPTAMLGPRAPTEGEAQLYTVVCIPGMSVV